TACSGPIRARPSASRACAPWRAWRPRRRVPGAAAPERRLMAAPGEAARGAALALAGAVLRHARPLDEAWQAGLAPGGAPARLEPRDRAFARQLVATVLRRLGQIDDALARCLQRPLKPADASIQDVLRLAAAQILFLRTPAHAAVDAAVRQAGRRPHLRGLVN